MSRAGIGKGGRSMAARIVAQRYSTPELPRHFHDR
jgi:hypothetical protein